MASLLVASLLGLALLKTVLIHRRQMQVIDARQQCFWLAEAGAGRAMAKLAGSSEYRGETWEVPAEVLGTARAAVVTIAVNPANGSPAARLVRAEARIAGGRGGDVAFRRELIVRLRQSVTAGPNEANETKQNAAAAAVSESDNR